MSANTNNWIAEIVAAHDAQHAARLAAMNARQDWNMAVYGTYFPNIRNAQPEVHAALVGHVWKPEAPIIPARISAKHPMAH